MYTHTTEMSCMYIFVIYAYSHILLCAATRVWLCAATKLLCTNCFITKGNFWFCCTVLFY